MTIYESSNNGNKNKLIKNEQIKKNTVSTKNQVLTLPPSYPSYNQKTPPPIPQFKVVRIGMRNFLTPHWHMLF